MELVTNLSESNAISKEFNDDYMRIKQIWHIQYYSSIYDMDRIDKLLNCNHVWYLLDSQHEYFCSQCHGKQNKWNM